MIVVDSAVWIDQLHTPDPRFGEILFEQLVVMHPFVIGEILLGNLHNRADIKLRLLQLDPAPVADEAEILSLIESASLHGSGIGYVDAHLLGSTLLMAGGRLWTRDRRLAAVAERLGIAFAA